MDIIAAIKYEAVQNQINPNWIEAIIIQESNWNKYAIRLEANYEYLFQPEFFAKKLGNTVATEVMCQKMSWGLGQIMLALAREQGHGGNAGELFEPEVNIHHIALRLKALYKISTVDEDVFAMYNGGPGKIHKKGGVYENQKYVDSVKNHLKSLND